jgi:hypothetical protein
MMKRGAKIEQESDEKVAVPPEEPQPKNRCFSCGIFRKSTFRRRSQNTYNFNKKEKKLLAEK